MSLAFFISTIIACLAVGARYGAFPGWMTLAGGIALTGLAHQIEEFLEKKGLA